MIDDEIETHLRERISEAYPDLEANQIIIKIVEARSNFSAAHNRRSNANKFTICQETMTAIVVISNEDRLDRAVLIRLLPRKKIDLGDEWALQEYRRVVHSDQVDVINFKGLTFYVDYTREIYEN